MPRRTFRVRAACFFLQQLRSCRRPLPVAGLGPTLATALVSLGPHLVLAAPVLLGGLPLLAVLAPPATAQTTQTFISNLGQTTELGSAHVLSLDGAQAFTTGSHGPGYKLTSVKLKFRSIIQAGNAGRITVAIHADSSGSPGSSLGTLTNPTISTGSNQEHTFTASGQGIDLATNTTYWVVMDATAILSQSDTEGLALTSSSNEDADSASGWSIADNSLLRTWNSSGSWSSRQTQSLQIEIVGTANAAKPEVSIAAKSASAVTEGGDVEFTLTANPAPTSAIQVGLTVEDAPNADFIPSTTQGVQAGTIQAGQTTGNVVITTTGGNSETTDEPSGNVKVTVANGTDYTVSSSNSSATVKVTDDDPTTVTLSLQDTEATEGSGDVALLRLVLGRHLWAGESLQVPLVFSGGAVGTDFTLSLLTTTGVSLSGSTVTFTGSTSTSARAVTVFLNALQDVDTTDDTVTVSIPSSSTGSGTILTATGLDGGAAGSRSGTGEIVLIDTTPSKPTGFSATAGNGEVTLNWANPSNSDITGWQFQQKEGTGNYGSWQPISGSGSSTTSHTVTGLTNGTLYTFRIRAVAGSANGTQSDEATATPQAPVPVVQFGAATYSGSEAAGSRTVTVGLSASPAFSGATSVSYSVSGTASEGDDFSPLSDTVSMTGGSGSIAVTILDDRIDEGSETIVLNLVAATGYTVGARGRATITIADNDRAGVTISSSSVSVTEASGTGRTNTYTVVLASEPTHSVSITVISGDTAAATVSPSALTFSTSNWDTAQMVTVTAVDDDVDQSSDRSATISHSATSSDAKYNGNNISISDVSATVVDKVDNDGAGVSISETSGSTSVREDKAVRPCWASPGKTLVAADGCIVASVPAWCCGHSRCRFVGHGSHAAAGRRAAAGGASGSQTA